MKLGTNVLRATVAALLIAVAIGALPRVAAQEDASSGSAARVDVSCWSTGSETTACAFTPSGNVSWLSVPAAILCAPVVDAGAAASGADGFGQAIAGDAIVLTFAGAVTAGGTASYAAEVDGVSTSVGGSSIACDSSDSGPISSADEVDGSADSATGDGAGGPTADVQASPTAGEPNDGQGDLPPVADDEGTSEPTEIADVTVTVGAYDCTVDPGADDPATVAGCSPSAGLDISGTADGNDLGTVTTDGTGLAVFTAPDGSAVAFTEDAATIPAGYVQVGSGSVSGTAAEGLVLTLVHVGNGRLQLVAGSCPTAGETRTEFRVIEPNSVTAAATPACAVQKGATFAISGDGSIGDLTVTTGDDGAWRGHLPAGTYTVTDDSGANAQVTVVADEISIVITVDYVAAPLGVVNVSRFACDRQETSGIAIELSGKRPPYRNDDDCTVSTGDIAIDVLAEVSTSSAKSFSLGPDGTEEVGLPSGSYVITDLATGRTATFDLNAGTRIYVAIVDRVVGGDGIGGGSDDGGGSDGTGSPGGDTTPTPGAGNGNAGGDGTAVDGGSTDGGTDTGTGGTDEAGTGADEVAGVTTLPVTGARNSGGVSDALLELLLIAVAAGAVGATIAARRRFA